MICNRKQFIDYWNNIDPSLTNSSSPLWTYENYIQRRCRWFVKLDRPVTRLDSDEVKKEYRIWITKHCRGLVLCYSSGETEEWWGFTHKPDLTFWILKWA